MIFWLKFSFLQAELNKNSDWLDLNTSWLPSANIYILMGILWVPCLHYGETSTCSIWVGRRKGFFHQIKLCTGMTCTAHISHFLTKFSGLHFEVGGGNMLMSKRVCSCFMKAAWLWILHDELAGTLSGIHSNTTLKLVTCSMSSRINVVIRDSFELTECPRFDKYKLDLETETYFSKSRD